MKKIGVMSMIAGGVTAAVIGFAGPAQADVSAAGPTQANASSFAYGGHGYGHGFGYGHHGFYYG